jgi:hypothetical protein
MPSVLNLIVILISSSLLAALQHFGRSLSDYCHIQFNYEGSTMYFTGSVYMYLGLVFFACILFYSFVLMGLM